MAIWKTETEKKIYEWEDKNLINYNGYVLKGQGRQSVVSNMQQRGYDGMRVSPAVTNKFGKKYRAVFGAQIEPDYRQGKDKKGKNYPKVTWTKQGYIKDGSAKPGSRIFTAHGGMYNTERLKSLMMKR